MTHNTTHLKKLYVQQIVKGLFYLLDVLLFHIVDKNIGLLLREECWVIHGSVFSSVFSWITSSTTFHSNSTIFLK